MQGPDPRCVGSVGRGWGWEGLVPCGCLGAPGRGGSPGAGWEARPGCGLGAPDGKGRPLGGFPGGLGRRGSPGAVGASQGSQGGRRSRPRGVGGTRGQGLLRTAGAARGGLGSELAAGARRVGSGGAGRGRAGGGRWGPGPDARRGPGGVGGEAGNVAGARCGRAAGGRVSPRLGIPLLCKRSGHGSPRTPLLAFCSWGHTLIP